MKEAPLLILLSVKSTLYFEGIKSLLSTGKDQGIRFSVHCSASLGIMRPDIIIVDGNNMDYRLFAHYPEAKILVIDNGLLQEELLSVVSSFKIYGVISPDTDNRLFKKALEVISRGEVWLGNNIVRQLIQTGRTHPRHVNLDGASDRERDVIKYVCAGYSNKEIAQALCLSEQTVKAHLNRIFRKFNITNRSKLILALQEKGTLQQYSRRPI